MELGTEMVVLVFGLTLALQNRELGRSSSVWFSWLTSHGGDLHPMSKLEKGKLGPQYFQLTRVEPLPYQWGQSGGRGDPTFYSHLPGI